MFQLCVFCLVLSYIFCHFVVVLSVFIYSFPELNEHFYYHYFELSGILLISLSLRFLFWGLSCAFVWNIFLCFPIFLDSLCSYMLNERAISPSLKGVVLCRQWSVLFNHALVLGCFSNCLSNWPVQLRNSLPLGNERLALKGHPLFKLSAPAGFWGPKESRVLTSPTPRHL